MHPVGMDPHNRLYRRRDLWFSDAQLRENVRGGLLLHVSRGWYAHPTADCDAISARQVGGMLTAQSFLTKFGVWLHDDSRLHILVPPNAARLHPERADKPCLHYLSSVSGKSARIVQALQAMAACSPHVHLVAAMDSCLERRLVRWAELQRAAQNVRGKFERALRAARDDAGSGLESEARCIFNAMGLRYRTQVQIPNVGRVDFVIGNSLVVEVDGFEYHSRQQFHQDRARDLRLATMGYRVLRLSAPMLRDSAVLEQLQNVMRRRLHRRPVFDGIQPVLTAAPDRNPG